MKIEKLIDWTSNYDNPDINTVIFAISDIIDKINEIIEVVNKREK